MSTSNAQRRRSIRHLTAFAPLLVVLGCSELFGLDEPGDEALAGGSGGASGSSGAGSGGTSGAGQGGSEGGSAGAGEGGEAGAAIGGGASGNGGSGGKAGSSGKGGSAGSNGGSGGAAGSAGSSTGGSGNAGAGTENPFPELETPCSVPGALACVRPHSPQTSYCDGTVWQPGEDCSAIANHHCDRRTGACALVICNPKIPQCNGDVWTACGPDHVTVDFIDCPFGCTPMAGCNRPSPNEVSFERPMPIEVADGPWPEPRIPVCWVDEAEWEPGETAWIRQVVDAEWGRRTAVSFTGWEECEGSAAEHGARVELRRIGECELELIRMQRNGYPGPGAALPVSLCASVLNIEGDKIGPDVSLLRATALHAFGHVLDQDDAYYSGSINTNVMTAGAYFPSLTALSVTTTSLSTLHAVYGPKPTLSLVHRGGRCLAGGSGVLSQRSCDAASDQAFRFSQGRLEHVASGDCLRTSGEAAGLGACLGADSWLPARVEWRGQGGLCVGRRTNPQATQPLGAEACSASRASDQQWRFEFLDGGRVRIRLVQTSECVLRPPDWSTTNALLGPCDGVRDAFEVRDGRLETNGQCLHSGSVLTFWPCSGSYLQRFAISGAFQHAIGALTLADTTGANLTVTPLAASPLPNQIFDYHF